MLSKNDFKYYSSLKQKKYRRIEKKFIAEGMRNVHEGITGKLFCELIITTAAFALKNGDFLEKAKTEPIKVEEISDKDFNKLADTQNPQGVLGIFHQPDKPFLEKEEFSPLIIVLDDISDPGNVGTIIRTCDWFGIKQLVAGESTADLFNPKVVRSAMGGHFHIELYEENLKETLLILKKRGYIIAATDTKGENIFQFKKPEKTVMIFSSEAEGISPSLLPYINERVTIPGKGEAESLNVASAAAIILAQISR